MANTTLSFAEISYLKNAVINKYCQVTNQDVAVLTKNLNGSIKYYEYMTDVITEYLNDDDNLVSYLDSISEGPLKTILKKWLDGNTRSRNLADKPAVSENILRKLIFDSERLRTDMAFKDFFVLGCYIFIGKDRSQALKDLPAVKVNQIQKTIHPTQYSGVLPGKQHPDKELKFTLKPLENGTATGKNINFDFNGDPVTLNRLNLDEGNNTITSKVQAKIFFEDGNWMLENFSEFNTTYLQVIRPATLQKGDVIIFGDKRFLFEG
jgi:hypothetical protein